MSNARNLGNITTGGHQGARVADVTTEVANLVDSAPGTLNTLNELAAALGDDANFSTTVTNSIATKLPLAGGTMTGNLTLGDSTKAVFGNDSDLEIYFDGNSKIADVGDGKLELHSNGTGVFIQKGATEYMAKFETDGAVTLYHDNSPKLATISSGIDVTGRVGIGSDSPAYALDAVGSTGNTAYLRVTRATASQGEVGVWLNDWAMYQKTNSANLHWYRAVTGDLLTLTTTGRVGIGSTDPGSTFDVRNGTANTQVASFSGADSGGGLKIKTASTTRNDDTVIFNASDAFGEIAFASDNTEVMRISDSYKVGIGTNDPQQMLHIRGTSPQIMLEDSDATGTPYSKVSGADGNLYLQADEGNEAASSFISMRVDGSEKLKLTDTTIRVGGGGSVDSANTQFNMEFPATGGINFGSGYTFSNIFGDALGNLFIKANAYPANTGSESRIEFKAANSGGGAGDVMTYAGNGILTIGSNYGTNGGWEGASSNPKLQVEQDDAYRGISLRVTGSSNVHPTLSLDRSGPSGGQTTNSAKLGQIIFNGSSGSYIGRVAASITAEQFGDYTGGYVPGQLKFNTSNTTATHNGQSPSGSHQKRLTINPAGDFLIGSQFNYHVLSGTANPNVAFQYDFYRDTYGHPMKITCAISHWNSGYMSYTEGFYWGFNTAMSSNVLHSYNGGNGSWTISFPTNNIVRVRMNGDASYGYGSGWYIKLEGNLRRTHTHA